MKTNTKTMGKDTIKLDSKKAALAGGIVLVAVAAIAVWQVSKRRKRPVGGGMGASVAAMGRPATRGRGGFACTSRSYPLAYGTCHPDVAALQRYLKGKGASLGSTGPRRDGVDGQFGTKTEAAAKRFLGKASLGQKDMREIKNKTR